VHWLAQSDLKRRSGLTDQQVTAKVRRFYMEFRTSLTTAMIRRNDLDNPYMTERARRTLINDVLRYSQLFTRAGRKKKPVQSVRPASIPARRAA